MSKVTIAFNWQLKVFLMLFVICFSILIGLIIKNVNEDVSILKKYSSDISFYYDNSFRLVDEDGANVTLHNNNSGIIVIKKMKYLKRYQAYDPSAIADSLSSQTLTDDDYKLTGRLEKDGKYYHLYTNDQKKRQIETIISMDEKGISLIIYQADDKEFDLNLQTLDVIEKSLTL